MKRKSVIIIIILFVISLLLIFTHIYFSKREKVVDEGNKINYKIESDDVGKKALSILTINGKEVSDRIKGGFYDIEIEEKDDFLIVNTVREELCSSDIAKDYGNIYIFDYKGHLLYKSTDYDMQLAKLTYDGNYVYNANEKNIVLNYHIACNGLSCNICNTVDSKTEITYDAFSKAKFKISFANGSFKEREMIESTLISDDEKYNKNCKSFTSEMVCNNVNNDKDGKNSVDDSSNNSAKENDITSSKDDDKELVGDINLDGKVDRIDSTLLSRHVAGMEGYEITNSMAKRNADVNGDGKIDVLDDTILSRHVAHWDGYDVLPYTGIVE